MTNQTKFTSTVIARVLKKLEAIQQTAKPFFINLNILIILWIASKTSFSRNDNSEQILFNLSLRDHEVVEAIAKF